MKKRKRRSEKPAAPVKVATPVAPIGFVCKCGASHIFASYVQAHWGVRLRFMCPDCKLVVGVYRGRVTEGEFTAEAIYKRESC